MPVRWDCYCTKRDSADRSVADSLSATVAIASAVAIAAAVATAGSELLRPRALVLERSERLRQLLRQWPATVAVLHTRHGAAHDLPQSPTVSWGWEQVRIPRFRGRTA